MSSVENGYNPLHPHEPRVPVVLSDDGSCLVCKGEYAVGALAQEVARLRSRLDVLRAAFLAHIDAPGDVEPLLRACQEAVRGLVDLPGSSEGRKP